MRRLALVAPAVVLALLISRPCAGSNPEATTGTSNAVQALAFDFARHPKAGADDLYKFLHQALFGPGHAIQDTAAAAAILRRELEGLGPPSAADRMCDTLGGNPILVRVNLRPFAAGDFDDKALIEAFAATANDVRGDPEQMDVALELVVDWLKTENRHDLANALHTRARELKKQGYPAIHHSAAYVEAYQPAYRVVAASLAAAHEWCGSAF